MTDDDDSVYELFQAKRRAMQRKRAENRDTSVQLLKDRKVEFTSHNDGAHLRVKRGEGWIDFWPGTGLWKHGVKTGRGVFSLLKYLKV